MAVPEADPTDLQAVAARYRAAMPGGDLVELDLTPYDRTGVPNVATVWGQGRGSVHGTGFGATAEQATVGALGELAEAVLVNPVVEALPRTRASYAELLRRHGPDGVADPVSLVLEAGSDYSPDRPLDWVPVTRWRTGEVVLVPIELVASEAHTLPPDPPPGGWLVTAITNGLGAGASIEQAVAHGLLEIIQRDGDTVEHRALDTGVVLDLSGATDPLVDRLVEGYRAVGIQPIVKLASTELATVVYCVGRDTDPDTPALAVTAMGEAADLDRDAAVVKALLEYGSSRGRKIVGFGPLEQVERRDPAYLARELADPLGPQEPRALEAMTAWSRMSAAQLTALVAPTLFRTETTVALDSLPTQAKPDTAAALLDELLTRLSAYDVLVLPAGSGDSGDTGDTGDIRAAKVLVPGLEVETLSYLRIGERVLRRLLDRDSPLVGLGRPDSADRLPIHLTAAATERLGGPAWLDRAVVAATVGPLYPLYREPDRFALQRLQEGR